MAFLGRRGVAQSHDDWNFFVLESFVRSPI